MGGIAHNYKGQRSTAGLQSSAPVEALVSLEAVAAATVAVATITVAAVTILAAAIAAVAVTLQLIGDQSESFASP